MTPETVLRVLKVQEAVGRLEAEGGTAWLEGDRPRAELPEDADVGDALEVLRDDREAVLAYLQARALNGSWPEYVTLDLANGQSVTVCFGQPTGADRIELTPRDLRMLKMALEVLDGQVVGVRAPRAKPVH